MAEETKKNEISTFAARVAEIVEARGLNVAQLGLGIGASKSAVKNLIKGGREMNVVNAVRLANLLGVSIYELIGEEDKSATNAEKAKAFDGSRGESPVATAAIADAIKISARLNRLVAETIEKQDINVQRSVVSAIESALDVSGAAAAPKRAQSSPNKSRG